MTDPDLERLLRSNRAPELPAQYWAEFPSRVTHESRRRAERQTEFRFVPRAALWVRLFKLPAWKPLIAGCLALCCALTLIFWNKKTDSNTEQAQLAQAQKYYQEIEALFPNQLQSIVFDSTGPQLVLSERPAINSAEPLYVKLCAAQGCRRYITFSGQRIRFYDQEFEVLSSRQGEVLLIGERSVWSSGSSPARGTPFRIEARPLQAAAS